jgi:hypothetical protein
MLEHLFRKVVPRRWQKVGEGETLSMVLLLREPHFFRADELRAAAERAWGRSFAGGDGSMHSVAQSGPVTFLKAGPHLLNLFHYPKPYIDDPGENAEWLPQGIQKRAWVEHRACVGVDYMNRQSDVELGYCVLAKLVAEILNENCTAVYFPRDNVLSPNHGSLYAELQKMAASRETGV